MTATMVRVINSQTINRSILLDKIDESQGNSAGYAAKPKQKLYVPYVNPNDTTVPGYTDLIPSDNVQLQNSGKGVIAQLAARGKVSVLPVSTSQTKTPVVSGATGASNILTIRGSTLSSVYPDNTYIILTNLTGSKQTINVSGSELSSVITVANRLKAALNNHESNTGGSFHTNPDAADLVTAPNATDLPSVITLLNNIKSGYESHRNFIGTPATHGSADSAHVATAVGAMDLVTAALLANNLEIQFNAHRITTTGSPAVHAASDTVNVASGAVGTMVPTLIAIPFSPITIGTPTTGWRVQIQANSKKSSVATMP